MKGLASLSTSAIATCPTPSRCLIVPHVCPPARCTGPVLQIYSVRCVD